MRLSLISQNDAVACLALKGLLSRMAYPENGDPFENTLGAGCYAKRIVLDLDEAELFDTTGIGWLMGSHKRCVADGGQLILCSIPPIIDQGLRLVKLHKAFAIKPNRAAALAAAAEGRG